MPSILYRLCEALLPDYEVERELATGGMGTVFLARDVALDRMVAVKIVRPELATADATERFLNEARVLANLNHPNVVPVHRAGEAGGLSYYVMDYVEGETLQDRLQQGPLSAQEVLKLGRDLLDALEAVHGLGIVHRDIKPSNIFLIRGRALLADFGISRSSGPQTSSDSGVVRVRGTPGYMPPEQAFGWSLTPRTDIYATAMVLYEALTGRHWEALHPDQHGDWSGVPGSMARILRRALAWEPADRWPDARTFRRALWKTRTRKYRRRTLLLTVSGLIVGAFVAQFLFAPGGTPPADLAVLPFKVEGDLDSTVGVDLAVATQASISLTDLVPLPFTTDIQPDDAIRGTPAQLLEQLNARFYVDATVSREQNELVVKLRVFESDGPPLEAGEVRGGMTDEGDLGCQLGLEVVRFIDPNRLDQYRCILSGTEAQAVSAWLDGERAFRSQDWRAAAGHFEQALSLDSSFALAKWRLFVASRWLRIHSFWRDLEQLYTEQRHQLGEIDRMLLDAWRTPLGHEQFAKYEKAVTKYHRDPYAWLLYGADLHHRGPLVGIPLDSAAAVLLAATQRDSSLGPAYMQLSWALIQLGRREEARQAVDRLLAIAGPEAIVDPVDPRVFLWAYFERFAPDTALAARAQFVGGGTWTETQEEISTKAVGWASSFNLAPTQAEVAAALMELPAVPDSHRANAHQRLALALFALGRLSEAFTHFDSAAAIYGTREVELQSAQWRVLPGAFGMQGVDTGEVSRGRALLEAFAESSDLGLRAAWTLALEADARNDPVAANRWWARVRQRSGDAARDFGLFLEAVNAARLGDHSRAVALSEPLVPYDAEAAGQTDPFFRAGIYLKRGEWRTESGDRDADEEWLWYQNTDLIGWPSGALHAGEVDWAFGTYARFLRGRAALERRDRAGCENLDRVRELWVNADPGLQPLVDQARQHHSRSCR